MKAGIIGLPAVGKTTLFNLLTRGHAEVGKFGGGGSAPNLGVTRVPDRRLDWLAGIYSPKKVTPATVEFVDVAGLAPGAARERGFSPQLLSALRGVEALIHVVRGFENPSVPHSEGSLDPARDTEILELELAFADLAQIEKRLATLQAELDKRRPLDKQALEQEYPLLQRLQAHLEAEQPLRTMALTEAEDTLVRGYTFLSQKPLILLLNVGESEIGQPLPPAVLARAERRQFATLSLSARIEMEIAQMEDEEAAAFLTALGIAEPARDRLIRLAYETLRLLSFFTVGPDECRAWTLPHGATALQAAGRIHSDLARGFIRAEVIAFEDLHTCGSWNAARERGRLRLEGRDYVLQDGDCMSVRFNV